MNCMRCGAEMTSTTGGNYTCPKCNMSVNDLVYRPQNCDMPLPGGFGVQYGWVCPKCGKVLAPYVSECNCYKKHYTNTTTITESSPLPAEYTTISNNDGDWNKIQ